MRLWFLHFTDQSNSATYMNPGPAAKAAGYNCKCSRSFSQLGYRLKKRFAPYIDDWLEQEGLSESALKARLVGLISARETKTIRIKGKATFLDKAARELVTTAQSKIAADGTAYTEEHTVIAIDMDAIEVQRKALETALKMKGMLKEQVNVTGLDGLADRIIESRKRVEE